MGKPPLNGLRILVTRPEHQADKLVEKIESSGGYAIRFPAMVIIPQDDAIAATQQLLEQQSFDWTIFVSANAVRYASQAVQGRLDFGPHQHVAAIGEATAQALRAAGITELVTPVNKFDSEALLQRPELSDLTGKHCLIVRGRGGRQLLAEQLQSRGAKISFAELYRRMRPEVEPTELLHQWRQQGMDLVTVTSGELLDNLLLMIGDAGHTLLTATPLVVVSQRMKTAALNSGFKRVIQTRRAADRALLETIIDYATERNQQLGN